ncbi:MAG: ABC transporter permease [Bacteroidales bacterium]|jgi:putative ABC transport system permease protein|nr:ABC transporter permease [Bacteroidales bacterium]MDD2569528.1 ABC transporter permease [Bacteroidales bacterium]MDD2812022.1 ABC transporter permease [Bacteroidales bacterium]MDD3384828.1 ABC transporter permease [Bacteroidales bacterium]MDD3871179.1 ABC transporter permease [Bacteroidales bacterium]
MFGKYLHDIIIAVEAILANKLKSVLTALGIIFGVAAVISMLAIGSGAQQEILEQIKLVGVNNIIIEPIVDQTSSGSSEESDKESKRFSNGLNLLDVAAIKTVLPTVKEVSSEIQLNSFVQHNQIRRPTVLMGVNPSYFSLFNLRLERGDLFNQIHEESGQAVCVIGSSVAALLFPAENPIGKFLKVGHNWLRVIGVLQKREVLVSSSSAGLGISNTNDQVFVPSKTMLIRYLNRAMVNQKVGEVSSNVQIGGRGRGMRIAQTITTGSDDGTAETLNYNQLDKIVVQVAETNELEATTEILTRMLLRRHNGVADFKITVPELLLKQQQRTKDIFNIVLGAIASISLIVGGIGIMNIMLASVMERIREIGTRQAIGASRKDIIVQFLAESTLISIVGGLIGVILGIILSRLIMEFSDILTIVTPFSVLVAFGVSAAVGIIFGYLPAKRASEQDPVESLRA